jgi:hypothetical protein
MNVTGILLLCAGIAGCVPQIPGAVAWALVGVAGLLMII